MKNIKYCLCAIILLACLYGMAILYIFLEKHGYLIEVLLGVISILIYICYFSYSENQKLNKENGYLTKTIDNYKQYESKYRSVSRASKTLADYCKGNFNFIKQDLYYIKEWYNEHKELYPYGIEDANSFVDSGIKMIDEYYESLS